MTWVSLKTPDCAAWDQRDLSCVTAHHLRSSWCKWQQRFVHRRYHSVVFLRTSCSNVLATCPYRQSGRDTACSSRTVWTTDQLSILPVRRLDMVYGLFSDIGCIGKCWSRKRCIKKYLYEFQNSTSLIHRLLTYESDANNQLLFIIPSELNSPCFVSHASKLLKTLGNSRAESTVDWLTPVKSKQYWLRIFCCPTGLQKLWNSSTYM